MNPLAALRQINMVQYPGGQLIVSDATFDPETGKRRTHTLYEANPDTLPARIGPIAAAIAGQHPVVQNLDVTCERALLIEQLGRDRFRATLYQSAERASWGDRLWSHDAPDIESLSIWLVANFGPG